MFNDTGINFSFATYNAYEKEAFKLITRQVLQKLGTVVLDKFSDTINDDTIKMGWLGIGNQSTWHGYPDACFRISPNVDIPIISCDDSDKETPGDTTTIEAKLNWSDSKLMQLVATSVVVSFTEKAIHKDLLATVPTLMITPMCAKICVYDATQDYLLISETFQWVKKDEDNGYTFDREGLLLLWMTLNHR